MQNQFITSFMFQLAPQLPGLILWIVGIAISLYSRQKNPKKFLLTTISFSIFFLIALANPIFSAWMTTQYTKGGFSASQMNYGYQILGLVSTPFWLAAWVILFVAIFNQKYNSVETNLNQPSQ